MEENNPQGEQRIVKIAQVGPKVVEYKQGDKVLVNFSQPTQIIVQDPVLTEITLEAPKGSISQIINSPMRQEKRPVEYYLMWEHDILAKVLED